MDNRAGKDKHNSETDHANMKTLEDLINDAERQGLWLHCSYQDLWFSPSDLREANRDGRFRWGAMNFELRDPIEKLAKLIEKRATLDTEVFALERRLSRSEQSTTVKASNQ